MKEHYNKVLRDSDARVARFMEIQILDRNDPFFGGFPSADSIAEPKVAIYHLTTMTACCLNADSKWHLDAEVLRRILLALDYVRRSQRPGGYFDLVNCNFFSGPDTAFCTKRLLPVYVYLRRIAEGAQAADAAEKDVCAQLLPLYEAIVKDAAEALTHCGFHTPNHRWAIASVLMMCHRLLGGEAYKKAADAILLEGSDCNADGEYAERSAGNYNRINNDAMIMLAVATGDDAYYEPVVRNLTMMLTYIEPDDSIFTNNSTRQDRGRKIYPKDYYFEYLYMGDVLQKPEFLDAANEIMAAVDRHGLQLSLENDDYSRQARLAALEHAGSGFPADYHKFYKGSEIVRCRRKGYSYTIINHSAGFLYFQNGDFTVSMHIGASFCEHRSFIPETLASTGENAYALHQTMTGWYYLPFEEKPETSDWWKMDHTKRAQLHGPDMIFDVEVTEAENGIDVHIVNTGIDRAPLRVELAFDAGCRVETEHFAADGAEGGGIVAKSGTLTASRGRYAIEAGPCFGAHGFTAGKFGSMKRTEGCYTVYLTDFSCFEHTISLRAKPSLHD